MGKDLSVYSNVIDSPTNLVMSGVESDAYWDLAVGAGFDRLLVSFHYIQKKGKKWLRERMEKHPNVKLMIDSGAYTFHVNEEEYKQKPVSFFEDYVRKYTNWIKANKDIIFSCVEVDIANLVGFDKVDEFRRDYFEPLKDDGVLVCYVWHEFDGKKHWEEMCQRYDYVGFSLGTGGSMSESEVMKFINIARRYGAIVHGFALTRVEIMSRVPFFTGDSTTWLVGTQYGELNWFDGRKMKRLKKKDWKTVYKQKYVKLGANPKLMDEENPYELIRINAMVFKEAEKYIRKRVRGKMYWTEKQAIGGVSVTKKLIRRKKADVVEETEIIEGTEVTEKPIKTEGTKVVSKRTRENTPMDEVERPKTKFEQFQEQSQGEEKVIYDLAEQIEKIPSLEWFDGECEDYKDVYRDLGLPLDGIPQDEVLDILYNLCIFLKDTEEIETYEDEQLTGMAKLLLSKTVESREEAIDLLVDYLSKNVTGERQDFKVDDSLAYGEAPPRPKEREEYLEDEEYDTVDVSTEELTNFLPAPKENGDMPEVDEIDRELATIGVVAVRDEQGRFLKGQKKVRKPKSLASKHFPKLACNTCYKAGECPEFKPDHACAYDKIFKKFKTRNMDDLVDAMHSMADLNMERMSRLAFFEMMDGGMADPTLTSMIDQNLNIMMKMQQLNDMKNQIAVQQRRTMTMDGTVETTTTVQNPSGGILAQIFGMGGGSSPNEMDDDEAKPKRKIIDAE